MGFQTFADIMAADKGVTVKTLEGDAPAPANAPQVKSLGFMSSLIEGEVKADLDRTPADIKVCGICGLPLRGQPGTENMETCFL